MMDNVYPKEFELSKLVEKETKKALHEAMAQHGLKMPPKAPRGSLERSISKIRVKVGTTLKEAVNSLQEAFTVIPRSFLIRSEKLSDRTKSGHEALYKKYAETFNKVNIAVEAANREEAGSTSSAYRSLKIDETHNLNAIKLHELYFSNISDLASEVSVDSLPFMRLSRDFGNFENWQFDFMACGMSARTGWALTVYEPYRNRYMNILVDGHDVGLPVGCVPIIVMDMWEHAYYKDYLDDKKSYLISMMKELNWNVIEARMIVVENAQLNSLYQIQPVVNTVPQQMLTAAQEAGGQAPVEPVPTEKYQSQGPLAATTPPGPVTQAPGVQTR